jgi:AcrR family transcriptional regulator
MSAQPKAKTDGTRARIMETAETLFRRMGFAKTAVADIAGELRMSPANVYRFFSSKNAIVEAICQRCLADLEEKAWAVARSRTPATERIERLYLEILAYHKENLLTERRVNDMVLVAIEQNWAAIRTHKDKIRAVAELILRDGIEAGEFGQLDPRETARNIDRSLVNFVHPVLIAQLLQDGEDVEAELRATLRFLLRALAPG